MFAPAATMVVSDIAGEAVAVAVGNHGIIVGAAKDLVAVEAEASPMMPPLIRRAPRTEAVVGSTERPGAALDVAMNGRVGVARGVTAPIATLLRRWEARADPVGSKSPEMILVGNAAASVL